MDEQLGGGRAMHPCHLVFEHRSEPLVGSKRAAEDASDGGSVRILCDVCETTHKLGEGSQIFGNFMRSHVLKPAHEQAAARRAAAARDAEVLPEAAPPEALAAIGVGFLPDEPSPAALPADDGALYMTPRHDAALLDLLASGLVLKGATARRSAARTARTIWDPLGGASTTTRRRAYASSSTLRVRSARSTTLWRPQNRCARGRRAQSASRARSTPAAARGRARSGRSRRQRRLLRAIAQHRPPSATPREPSSAAAAAAAAVVAAERVARGACC